MPYFTPTRDDNGKERDHFLFPFSSLFGRFSSRRKNLSMFYLGARHRYYYGFISFCSCGDYSFRVQAGFQKCSAACQVVLQAGKLCS
jgi:hypothetical protein